MTIANWIMIGLFGAGQLLAVIGWMIKESGRRTDIEWRLKSLEEKAKHAEHDSEMIEQINRRLSTLITILREKDVVNGHPDLNDQ